MGRKRKNKIPREPFWKKYDWSVNPEVSRESLAISLIVLGILFILSIFSLAGKLGLFFVYIFDISFGVVGYLIPFVIVVIGIILLIPNRFTVKASTTGGIILCFFLFPALINPYGGWVGLSVFSMFRSIVGDLASYIFIVGLLVISLLLAFNTSFMNFLGKFSKSNEEVNINGQQPSTKVSVFTTVKNRMIGIPNRPQEQVAQSSPITVKKEEGWEFPSLDLLETSSTRATPGNIAKNVEIIQKTLKDFGIDVTMGDVNVGPTVSQYCLKPTEGVKLAAIVARANDLALSLAAHPIRIEAPIPGKSAVGIEIPNKIPAVVTLKEVLETKEFKTTNGYSNLCISLGRNVAGSPVVIDLKKMPHLLVAGSTGSGKSICLHSIILSFLYQNSPAQLRIIMVDPKRVEFTHYNGIPHLLTPVVTEVDKTVNVLRWAIGEMERRFKLFAETNRRDIESYNQNPPQGKLSYIVIIIDELADLMAQAANEVEASIVRIAQMARATGIHLVVATQRPSVDVITGLIKANITARIAFAVASQVDSRTIIDMGGAEKLLGKGDMLYISSDLGKPRRAQGSLIQEKEIKSVCDWLKRDGVAQYDESIINFSSQKRGMGGKGEAIDDNLFEDAKQVVIQAGKASASLLQRRLRVGYARAARLLDILEEEGIIGPADGAKPRDILLDGYDSSASFNNTYREPPQVPPQIQ